MKFKHQLFCFLVIAGLSSCKHLGHDKSVQEAEDQADNAQIVRPKMSNDADFVVKALNMGMFEVQAAQLAEKKSSVHELKALAAKVENDRLKVNEQLAILATEKNIVAPDSMSNDMQEKVSKLAKLEGPEFDKEYANLILDQHREVIDEFEQISMNAVDADIKQLAVDALPGMRTNYEEAAKVKEVVAKKYK